MQSIFLNREKIYLYYIMKNAYNLNQIAWLFIYIFAFGLSEFYVNKYLITSISKITYYVLFGIIGIIILSLIK